MTSLSHGKIIVFDIAMIDVSKDKEYIIQGTDPDGDVYFFDDAGECNFSASVCGDGTGHFTVVG